MDVITRDALSDFQRNPCFRPYRKKTVTWAVRMNGPFETQTKEGRLHCPNGYLAFDTAGWPYPIAVSDFEAMYEPTSEEK